MLSEGERNGVRKLLRMISTEDLVQLAKTVTNRLVFVENREEAAKAIIMYSDSAEQFLRRKLVKRDLIFIYLADLNVPMSPGADKSKLIQRVLECWQTTVDDPSRGQIAGNDTRQMTDDSRQTTDDTRQTTDNTRQTRDDNMGHPPSCQDLAVHFSSWFFTQLNQLHPQHPAGATGDWGPRHFLDDASLKLYVLRGTDRSLDAYGGSDLVSQRLGCLVKEEELVFNPNLSAEGTRGCGEPHGLVMISVCGTIHKAGTCIGLFEQSFGLVRDPMAENNWKIKFIKLQMKEESSRSVPKLGQFPQL
eukprot:XP_003731273.2 PREDICTED: uncharacterized protein C3orf38-like [Strongylocentrotus purpuratus]